MAEVIEDPYKHPEVFFWYCSQLKTGKWSIGLFQKLLILVSEIAINPLYKDLSKKILVMLKDQHFLLPREIFSGAQADEINEILLLVKKIPTLEETDIRIFESLAEVVRPAERKHAESLHNQDVIWTTRNGYDLICEKAKGLSEELLVIAKDMETARFYGDLRENAEYSDAVERRKRVQKSIKDISASLQKCKIISSHEVDVSEVSIGTSVTLQAPDGSMIKYTILGPWDISFEKNIVSHKSIIAQNMLGKTVGEDVLINEQPHSIIHIASAFDA